MKHSSSRIMSSEYILLPCSIIYSSYELNDEHTNFLNYTPIPVTYNITDDVATLNQTYWDDDSIEAIEAGAPGRVGVSIDIEKDSTILDPNQLNKVLYNTFDWINYIRTMK